MDASAVQSNLDIIWILTAAALVMFMHAGFTALECGLTRAKNSINVAMKNLTDFIVAILIFWMVGYGLMFGESYSGLFGASLFGLDGMNEPKDYAIFIFQATFAGTAATIVSGAVAERMRFSAYAIVAVIIIAFIYPVSGHWIWSSEGWLAQKGFVDFAGSTVVHSLGGWVGLAGAIVLGARLGRFDAQGKPNKFHGQNLVLAVIGVIILWFGWFGFNGGSTLKGDTSVALILLNTMLSAAAGGISCFLVSMLMKTGTVSIEKMLNGVIGGLVAITAGCAVVEPGGAIFIGLMAGAIVYAGEELLLKVFKIDDPVNVVSAHGIAGAWGTLALAFAAPAANLPLGNAGAQFAVQLQGVVAVFLWAFLTGFALFYLLKMLSFLRVTPDAETKGLNIHEHGASSGLLETMNAMDQIVRAYNQNHLSAMNEGGDLTRRIQVEFGEEGHEIATLFNQLMDYFHNTIFDIKKGMNDVLNAAKLLAASSEEMRTESSEQNENTEAIALSIREMSEAIHHVAESTAQASLTVESAYEDSDLSQSSLKETIQSISDLASKVTVAYNSIHDLQNRMANIESIVETISGISAQTNLLALNAAIEAARAGDAGRGFVVVAEEVRNLSNRTFEATDTIKNLIMELKQTANEAKVFIDQGKQSAESTVIKAEASKVSIGKITSKVRDLASMSTQIASATEEQSTTVVSVEERIARFMELVKHSKTRASVVAGTSNELNDLAHDLQLRVEGLKVAETGRIIVH